MREEASLLEEEDSLEENVRISVPLFLTLQGKKADVQNADNISPIRRKRTKPRESFLKSRLTTWSRASPTLSTVP